jgi:hypothetical protein
LRQTRKCGSRKEFDIIPNPEPCLSEKVMETVPYCSMKRSAFSKKEGLPSISSRASNMGLPTTKDFTGLRPLPEKSFNSHRLRNWNNRSENIPSRTNLLQNRDLELKAHSYQQFTECYLL